MTAESSPQHSDIQRPILLVRVHNYNRVSFGAILGACPAPLLERFEILLWESSEPAPQALFQRPTLMLYSYMWTWLSQVRQEVEEVRALARGSAYRVTLLAGGSQASTVPEEALGIGFDAVIAGEGEHLFPAFLETWLDGRSPVGVVRAPTAEVDLNRFMGFHPIMNYLPPIEISRGCRFGCAYCVVPRLHRGTLRHRSVDQIAAIVREYFKIKPGRKRIKFLSPNSFAYGSDGYTPNVSALRDLLERLKAEGVAELNFGTFPAEVRPDFVTREVLEVVKAYVSNKTIVMGIQTGNDRHLAAMGRGHTRAQAVEAIRLLREFGFLPHVDFIIGLPGQTFDDQEELLTFMEEMVHSYSIRVHMHTFMPLPGTPWADKSAEAISRPAWERLKALSRAGVLDGWWENQIGYSRRKP